jgi:hypothetical protein
MISPVGLDARRRGLAPDFAIIQCAAQSVTNTS